jgi:hypothetical protein
VVEGYRRLYIWVEGTDDERFFRSVVLPRMAGRYDDIRLTRYAGLTTERVNNFLASIRAMQADYIFVSDIDRAPCVTEKKRTLAARYARLDPGSIIVVKAEIESWYMAGLDAEACATFNLRQVRDTQEITKERFVQMAPAGFRSGLDFMIEVLNHFSADVARSQNASFDYFATKHGLS